jgi:hypothetical protein
MRVGDDGDDTERQRENHRQSENHRPHDHRRATSPPQGGCRTGPFPDLAPPPPRPICPNLLTAPWPTDRHTVPSRGVNRPKAARTGLDIAPIVPCPRAPTTLRPPGRPGTDSPSSPGSALAPRRALPRRPRSPRTPHRDLLAECDVVPTARRASLCHAALPCAPSLPASARPGKEEKKRGRGRSHERGPTDEDQVEDRSTRPHGGRSGPDRPGESSWTTRSEPGGPVRPGQAGWSSRSR